LELQNLSLQSLQAQPPRDPVHKPEFHVRAGALETRGHREDSQPRPMLPWSLA
jgi:hypothetical protein